MLHLEKGAMNEAIAVAAILLNGLEKLFSYRLQAKAPQTMRESNPIARMVIRRCGLFPTHVGFFILSFLIVCITYSLSSVSLIAELCLLLEFLCTALVFFNNWFLNRLCNRRFLHVTCGEEGKT